jgi:hypothetical protein
MALVSDKRCSRERCHQMPSRADRGRQSKSRRHQELPSCGCLGGHKRRERFSADAHLGDVSGDSLQVTGQVIGAVESVFGVLRQAALDDPAKRRRSLRAERRDGLRFLADDSG